MYIDICWLLIYGVRSFGDEVHRASKRFGFKEVGEDDDWNLYWTDFSVSLERVMEMKRYQVRADDKPYGVRVAVAMIYRIVNKLQQPKSTVEFFITSPLTASRCPARDITVPKSTAPTTGHRLGTYGCRAFVIAGLSAWNSLPDPVRNPNASKTAFRRLLKTYLFERC